MTTAIEVFALIHFAVIGLSHVVQHRAWAEFFECLSALGRPGVFCNALLHFAFGTLIVAFHNVWTGIPAVLTVLGWGFGVKGALYLCLPSVGARSMAKVSSANSKQFIPAGVFMLALAGLLAFDLISG